MTLQQLAIPFGASLLSLTIEDIMTVYTFDIFINNKGSKSIEKVDFELTKKEMQSDKTVFEEAIAKKLEVDSVGILMITEKFTKKLLEK